MYAFECLESEHSSNNPAGILSRDRNHHGQQLVLQTEQWTSPLKTDT